jgi:hypothetical protein
MKSKLITAFFFLLAIVTLEVMPACSKTAEPVSFPGGAPAMAVISPANYSSTNGDVNINVVVTNFALAGASAQANIPGQGHISYCLAHTDSPGTAPVIQVPFLGTDTNCQMVAATYNIGQAVSPGTYLITLSLVNNDNSNINPPVTQSIQITVNGSGIHNVTLNVTTQ